MLSEEEEKIISTKLENSLIKYLREEVIDREEPSLENVSFVLGYKNTENLVKLSENLIEHSKSLNRWTKSLTIISGALVIVAIAQIAINACS